MSPEEMVEEAHKCHHLRQMPPLTTWLINEHDSLDGERLRALGNIVIPRMASLACSILGNAQDKRL